MDLRGTPCPINYVKTKLKLELMQPDEILEVIVDDGEPIESVPRSVAADGHEVVGSFQLEDGSYRLWIRRGDV